MRLSMSSSKTRNSGSVICIRNTNLKTSNKWLKKRVITSLRIQHSISVRARSQLKVKLAKRVKNIRELLRRELWKTLHSSKMKPMSVVQIMSLQKLRRILKIAGMPSQSSQLTPIPIIIQILSNLFLKLRPTSTKWSSSISNSRSLLQV